MKQKPILLGVLLAAFIHAQPPSAAPRITLDEAIQEGLVKNLDIAAEKLNISVAEAREITARLRPNPVLTVSGQTLNVLGAKYNPDTPLGPNQTNIHTDLSTSRSAPTR